MGRRLVKLPTHVESGLLEAGRVPSIADQVRLTLVADEEARCQAVERETGKRVKRREIEVPRARVGPQALCQNVDYLERVTRFDYDLSSSAFCEYAQRRGVLSLAGVPGGRRWEIFQDHQITKATYLADPYFQSAQEYDGVRHPYSPEAMEANWKVISFGRAVLQDCWELFQSTHADTERAG